MADERSIEAGVRRLNAAMDALEIALGRHQANGKAVGDLEAELQSLSDDRSELAQQLDALRQQSAKLEQVNDNVARRLQSAIGAITDLISKGGS
jgi:FtsZ-binding cell division protein ZapB